MAKAVAQKSSSKRAEPARIAAILAELETLYPTAHCELNYKNPFELLVATILSAQCTDKRVNLVTPLLFARFPDAKKMARADLGELQALIQSTGFFRNKAKNILGAAKLLCAEFGAEVPRTMPELLRLPGVARKTANVVLGTGFGQNEGMVVDTHIGRLAQRLGFSVAAAPEKIERDLCAKLPRADWTKIGHQMIWHGRRVCAARNPSCDACSLAPLCPSAATLGRSS